LFGAIDVCASVRHGSMRGADLRVAFSEFA
jgi:hypothetical protein